MVQTWALVESASGAANRLVMAIFIARLAVAQGFVWLPNDVSQHNIGKGAWAQLVFAIYGALSLKLFKLFLSSTLCCPTHHSTGPARKAAQVR